MKLTPVDRKAGGSCREMRGTIWQIEMGIILWRMGKEYQHQA